MKRLKNWRNFDIGATSKYIYSSVSFLLILLLFSCSKNNVVIVKSPDKEISVNICFDHTHLSLSVLNGGDTIIGTSPLGLMVNGSDIGKNATVNGNISEKIINEEYPLYGNHARGKNHCREVTIPLKNELVAYRLQVRAYDDGIAVRYLIHSDTNVIIGGDNTSFQIDPSAECYWAEFKYSNEQLHTVSRFSQIPVDKVIGAPITVKSSHFYLSFTEASCIDFPALSWKKEGDMIKVNFKTNPEGWDAGSGQIVSPWRLAIIADDLTELVNSDLVRNLCDAPGPDKDFSWVKPGRALWNWWSVGHGKYQDQKDWYDAAARLTWEYYLIDAGWKDWTNGDMDAWDCLKDVIDYGKSKGVETLIWANSNEMPDMKSIVTYLDKVKKTGASGIKIDFIPAPTPEIMRWYETVREETYKRQLLCVFHGCVKPSGLSRTWPHELTREGVRGNEWHMTRYNRIMPKDQDSLIPFTRCIAGAADFTPVIFNPKELNGYTWTHELAQAIIYCSPLTHFADSYKFYLDSDAEDILRDIPVVWDETLVLPCTELGKVAAFARRSGDEWWIGITNGEKETNISFDLKFLKSEAKAQILSDKAGVPAAVVREEKILKQTDIINLQLQSGGGYLMRLEM